MFVKKRIMHYEVNEYICVSKIKVTLDCKHK